MPTSSTVTHQLPHHPLDPPTRALDCASALGAATTDRSVRGCHGRRPKGRAARGHAQLSKVCERRERAWHASGKAVVDEAPAAPKGLGRTTRNALLRSASYSAVQSAGLVLPKPLGVPQGSPCEYATRPLLHHPLDLPIRALDGTTAHGAATTDRNTHGQTHKQRAARGSTHR